MAGATVTTTDEEQIVALRAQLMMAGVKEEQLPDDGLVGILEVMPDVDLAKTACLMEPRPKWVHELIGAP